MAQRHRFTFVAAVVLTVFALAAPAAAQLTTGTVSGTVRDPQAGVIPGATVTLISERRGTRLPDAITNADGDFVFANVPPDTYTLQITMEGFKALRRGGIAVSAGDRVGLGTLTIEIGGLTETVLVTAESPLVQTQSGERSFTIATQSVENLPIGNRSFTAAATTTS